MEILIGFLLCLFLEGMAWLGWRAWQRTLPAPLPQPPVSGAQRANQAAYEANEAHHPQVVRLKVRRLRRRGKVEREYDPFD